MSNSNRSALHVALEGQQKSIKQVQDFIEKQAYVIRNQAQQIEVLRREAALSNTLVDYIANLAGVSKQVVAIRKKADVANPGAPIPDPPSEGPTETTEQAATPEAYDDVRNPGATPGSLTHVPAEMTTVALEPGESLPTAPFNELVNAQAPIAGTETHVPLQQTRIETDVRVGDPMNQQIAFPWTMGPNNSNGGNQRAAAKQGQPEKSPEDQEQRFVASLRLARLQIAADVAADGEIEDIALGQKIASSDKNLKEINDSIAMLEQVRDAQNRKQAAARPQNLVPRAAGGQRATASFAGGSAPMTANPPTTIEADVADADMFM